LTSVDFEACGRDEIVDPKVEKMDFYHHQMAKFESLQMEHAFTKVELLMHQSQGCRNKVEF
jgi:hypothetical protein